MRLLQLLLLIALFAFTAARNLPSSVSHFANISSITTGVEQTDQPIDWLEFNTGVDPPPTGTKPVDPKEQTIWCKAINRGRMFVNAMKLNEEDATKLLGWPHVESKWDGTLHEELIKWGYRDDDEQHKKADARCRFSDYSRVFYDLKISEKSAKEGGPNRCFSFAHKSGPAMELDAKGQMPKVDKQTYVVDGVKYPATDAALVMGANPVSGVVYFIDRISPETGLRHMVRDKYNPSQLPLLRSSSDIAWGMWNRVTTPQTIKNVKMFQSHDVVNEDTEIIIKRIVTTQLGLKKPKVWPGHTFEVTSEPGREAETEAALALIGSPNGLGAGYFLTQHKRQLGIKTISKVTIWLHSPDWTIPQMIFFVDEVELDEEKPAKPETSETPKIPEKPRA